MLKGKASIILLTVGLIQMISLYIMSYFPEPHTHSKSRIELELDLSDDATKSDLKNTTGFDTSDFAKKADLANLESNFDKLDIDKQFKR